MINLPFFIDGSVNNIKKELILPENFFEEIRDSVTANVWRGQRCTKEKISEAFDNPTRIKSLIEKRILINAADYFIQSELSDEENPDLFNRFGQSLYEFYTINLQNILEYLDAEEKFDDLSALDFHTAFGEMYNCARGFLFWLSPQYSVNL